MELSTMQTTTPCFGQTAEGIESWLRANVEIGASVAIRNTQAGLLHYVPAKVVRLGRGRFEVEPEEQYGLGTGGIPSTTLAKTAGIPKARPFQDEKYKSQN